MIILKYIKKRFLKIAESMKPQLHRKEVLAQKEILVEKDCQMRTVILEKHPIEHLYEKSLIRDDR